MTTANILSQRESSINHVSTGSFQYFRPGRNFFVSPGQCLRPADLIAGQADHVFAPAWRQLEGQQVLITFQGPHDYVSPSWYQTAGVPTWNYQAVHVYGSCRVFDDAGELAAVVDSLSERYESGFETPWKPQYRDAMLKAIIGVEIEIDEIQCKYKLSQNRSEADQRQVIDQLDNLQSESLAQAMRKTLL
jgi:transcriptional regulator